MHFQCTWKNKTGSICIHAFMHACMQLVHLRSFKIINTTDVICIDSLSTRPVFVHTIVSALKLHVSYHSTATCLTLQVITRSPNQLSRSNSICITEKRCVIVTSPPGNSVSDDNLKYWRRLSWGRCFVLGSRFYIPPFHTGSAIRFTPKLWHSYRHANLFSI